MQGYCQVQRGTEAKLTENTLRNFAKSLYDSQMPHSSTAQSRWDSLG
jgi:hypothetical protein